MSRTNPNSKVPEKLIVAQLASKLPPLGIEPAGTLPLSQNSASDRYLSQMNPFNTLSSYFFKIPFKTVVSWNCQGEKGPKYAHLLCIASVQNVWVLATSTLVYGATGLNKSSSVFLLHAATMPLTVLTSCNSSQLWSLESCAVYVKHLPFVLHTQPISFSHSITLTANGTRHMEQLSPFTCQFLPLRSAHSCSTPFSLFC
jgi:hypothetical protein